MFMFVFLQDLYLSRFCPPPSDHPNADFFEVSDIDTRREMAAFTYDLLLELMESLKDFSVMEETW